jgi:hypothetical protein
MQILADSGLDLARNPTNGAIETACGAPYSVIYGAAIPLSTPPRALEGAR